MSFGEENQQYGRMSLDTVAERTRQLEMRCDRKDKRMDEIQSSIDKLLEFQNRMLGYALAISSLVAISVQVIMTFFSNRGG